MRYSLLSIYRCMVPGHHPAADRVKLQLPRRLVRADLFKRYRTSPSSAHCLPSRRISRSPSLLSSLNPAGGIWTSRYKPAGQGTASGWPMETCSPTARSSSSILLLLCPARRSSLRRSANPDGQRAIESDQQRNTTATVECILSLSLCASLDDRLLCRIPPALLSPAGSALYLASTLVISLTLLGT